MDIRSGAAYPAGALSNFAPHPFMLDGVKITSMEGFLQSLKYANPDMQIEVCKLAGRAAKIKGSMKNWKDKQTLYWRGKEYKREELPYQELLKRAYSEMTRQNQGFANALRASGDATLTHSIGKSDAKQTVLTKQEFCRILTELRDKLSHSDTKER